MPKLGKGGETIERRATSDGAKKVRVEGESEGRA